MIQIYIKQTLSSWFSKLESMHMIPEIFGHVFYLRSVACIPPVEENKGL